ncbi:hypothetical protein BDV41DRAFT_378147 [Aspergillus transmontanensis]|uniref:Uncharacterized protein n=1 Tax=Aspergillus transmontanensis TaxID=1034304 RepID=A0A5N6WD66_9EURO|nr:hypothetical protein BDV41DRAFT_378147 [Aspergillus transmontanensis]
MTSTFFFPFLVFWHFGNSRLNFNIILGQNIILIVVLIEYKVPVYIAEVRYSILWFSTD